MISQMKGRIIFFQCVISSLHFIVILSEINEKRAKKLQGNQMHAFTIVKTQENELQTQNTVHFMLQEIRTLKLKRKQEQSKNWRQKE